MIFPSTRNREVAFKLSVSLRILLPSMLSGTSHARLRQAEILRTEMHEIKAGSIALLYCSARTSFCAPSGLAKGGRRSSMQLVAPLRHADTYEECRPSGVRRKERGHR